MSLDSDAVNCTDCPVGEYQPKSGQVFCVACPPRATTDGGAANALDCKCEAEYFMVANGTWVKGVWEPLSRPQCQVCVQGADCSMPGTTVATLKTLPGFWRAGSSTIHFDDLSCDLNTCAGGAFSGADPWALVSARAVIAEPSDAQCAPGQTGLMCSLCDAENRWARHMGAKCIQCGADINTEMAKIAGVLAGLCILGWLVTKRVIRPLLRGLLRRMTLTQLRKAIYKRQMKVKILLAFVQVATRLQATFRLKMPSIAKEFFAQLQFLEFFDVFSMILKVRLSHNTKCLLAGTLTVRPLQNVSCAYPTDYYTKVYVQTIGPLAALGLLYFAFLKTSEPAFFDLLLFVSFVVYPSSSGVLIQFFDCYPVWHGAAGTGATNYLLMDPSIKCTDDKWLATALVYVLPMTALFVVGFPAYYGKLVLGDRKFINPKCPNQRTAKRLKSIKNKVFSSQAALKVALGDYFGLHLEAAELDVLFSHWTRANVQVEGLKCPVSYVRLLELFEYGQSHERWSKTNQARQDGEDGAGRVAVAEPAPVLDSAPLALREKLQAHAIRAYQVVVTKAKPEKERWAIRAREGDDRAQRSAFLWKAYRPKFFWFEVFDMFRKFLLTGLPLILNSLFPNSSELSLAVGLLASMLGMAAYAAASPFADHQDSLLMLPAQMQVTLTMVCGMLMNFVGDNPVGQACIAALIILSFMPILGFGLYLLWNPDFDAAAYTSGGAVVRILGPFLEDMTDKAVAKFEKGANKAQKALASKAPAWGVSAEEETEAASTVKEAKAQAKQTKLRAVQLAIELIMNPNLDPVEDIRRLGGENAELVMRIVDTVKPLVEAGTPDLEDIAEMVEALFEVCSGTAAKHSSRIVEMMALKGLALTGVKKGHAIEKAVLEALKRIGGAGSEFRSFGDFSDAMLPVIHGDVSEEGVIQLLESLGIDKLVVGQALLPALFRKSLRLAGIADDAIATIGDRLDKTIGAWTTAVFDDAKRAIADCLDGEITQEDLENLLALAGMTKVEAYGLVATHILHQALAMVLPGCESTAMVTRVVSKVRATLQSADVTDPEFLAKVKQLLMECTDSETRSAAVFNLLQLVGESFESVAGQIVEPLVNSALLHAGFQASSHVAAQAGKGVKALLKDPTSAKDEIDVLMAQCKGILEGGMDLTEAVELLPQLLETVGLNSTTAMLAALEQALDRVWAAVGLESGAPVLKRVGATLESLISDPGAAAQAEATFAEVRSLIKDFAVAIKSCDSSAVWSVILQLLSSFGIEPQEAMQGLLPAMLTRVLRALAVTDGVIVSICLRNVAQLTAHDPQLTPGPHQRTVGGFVDAMASTANGALLQPLMDMLSEAVLSLGTPTGVGDAAPFSIGQALRLLEVLGVNAQDALLSVLSGTFLSKALEMVGVPMTHRFQKEARDSVLALAHCAEAQRQVKVSALESALGAAADAALNGGNPMGPLTEALSAAGVSVRSMSTVMAPLVAQALLRAVGIPKDHSVMQRAASAARAMVLHAESFDEACEMVGAGVPSASGEAATAVGVAGFATSASANAVHRGPELESPRQAALAVVVKLGIPQAAFWAAVKQASGSDLKMPELKAPNLLPASHPRPRLPLTHSPSPHPPPPPPLAPVSLSPPCSLLFFLPPPNLPPSLPLLPPGRRFSAHFEPAAAAPAAAPALNAVRAKRTARGQYKVSPAAGPGDEGPGQHLAQELQALPVVYEL
jgi:hypothetical protein